MLRWLALHQAQVTLGFLKAHTESHQAQEILGRDGQTALCGTLSLKEKVWQHQLLNGCERSLCFEKGKQTRTCHAGVSDAVAKQKDRIWTLKRDLSAAMKERDSLRQQLDQLKGKGLY